MLTFLLWLLAVLLVVGGLSRLLRGQLLEGVGWLIVAALIGPGGVSLIA